MAEDDSRHRIAEHTDRLRRLSWERLLPPAALVSVALLLPWGRLDPQDDDIGRLDLTRAGLLGVSGETDRAGALSANAAVTLASVRSRRADDAL